MDKQQADDLMQQYNMHWGEGETFDIKVTNSKNNACELLRILHRPEVLSDEEKLSVINGLRFDALYIKTHEGSKERFISTLGIVLDSLLESVRSNNTNKAEMIIMQMLVPVLREQDVTDGVKSHIENIFKLMEQWNGEV